MTNFRPDEDYFGSEMRVQEEALEEYDSRFVLRDADEMRATPMPDIKWAVPDVLPEGLAILGGDPKIGKSFLALQLCGAIGSGGLFLGSIDVAYGYAIYMSLEDPEWRVTKRLNGMFGADAALPGFYSRLEMGRWGSADWASLTVWLKKNPLCRAVVVDTFVHVKPEDKGGENVYETSSRLGKEMRAWAHEHHIALVLVHHKSKTNESSDPVKSLSGSIGFSGAADTVMLLSRTRTEREATLFITGRDVGEREISLVHQEHSGLWLMAGATSKKALPEQKTGPVGIVPQGPEYVTQECFTCHNPVMEKTLFGAVCRRCHPG
jgi:RecA-family ATPase